MAQLAQSQIHDRSHTRDREERAESSFQMSVPNELIGSVIGKTQYSTVQYSTVRYRADSHLLPD